MVKEAYFIFNVLFLILPMELARIDLEGLVIYSMDHTTLGWSSRT